MPIESVDHPPIIFPILCGNLKKSKSSTVFHFHAIEGNNKVKEFPTGILEAQKLILYSGGRGKPIQFTGLMADIQSVELKHKSYIKGKENSETEFYYEVTLKDSFEESDTLKGFINLSALFEKIDEKNRKLFQQYLPALTTWDNVLKSMTDL